MDIKYAKYKNHAKYTENIKYNKQAKCTQDLSAGRKGLETIQGNRFSHFASEGVLTIQQWKTWRCTDSQA